MRKLLLLMLACLTLSVLHAQTGSRDTKEEVVKEWAFIGESSTQLDVSYRLVKCSGKGQVHLQIFNENPNDQVAKFMIEVTNEADGASFRHDVSLAVQRAAIVQSGCDGGDALKQLRIELPAAYDITKLRVKITFTL